MNEYRLSQRLATIANFVPSGSRLADIGTDHAYLPVHLVLQGKIEKAVAGEINEGPLHSARSQVKQSHLENVIDVRQGDGLEVIRPGEVDVIVLAGMGGALIKHILEEGSGKLNGVHRLVLQPNKASHLLRRWLMEREWELKYEEIIEEDQQTYEILVAEPGDPRQPYRGLTIREKEKALLMGPYLLQKKTPGFIHKWCSELEKRQKVIMSLEQAKGVENRQKMERIRREIQMIEEELSQ